MRRSVLALLLPPLGLAAAGCAATAPAERGAIHTWEMRARVAQLAIGDSASRAHAILGRDPVHRPGHPRDPFPSPRRALSLVTPAGQSVRLELYVVAAHGADGCPDVQYEDAPLVFVDGVVAARDWVFVERNWRSWGGSLAELRDARDGHRCADPRP